MDPETLRFVGAAREYCAWIEGAMAPAEEEARTALAHLARLYHFALHLPERHSGLKAQSVPHDGWHSTYSKLGRVFPFAYYSGFIEPLTVPPLIRPWRRWLTISLTSGGISSPA